MDSKEGRNNIKVLGAYGTRSKDCGTSAFFLNSKNVIDAGNLLGPLDVDSIEIENIWLTHSHLDHIIDIAYILDNYFNLRKKSLNIIGLPQTIRAIQENFLNDLIWPNFSKIKLNNSEIMAVTYTQLEIGKEYNIGEREFIRAYETDHTVASCGYIYTKNDTSLLISADTHSLESTMKEIRNEKRIKSVVLECSFPNSMKELAIVSKHLTPELLFEQLKDVLDEDITLYINHIKPACLEKIIDEIAVNRGIFEPIILKDGDFITF